ncbi:hypothetical protein GC177_08280 [bacterium]|nr:hypothetical protein [bacterium]
MKKKRLVVLGICLIVAVWALIHFNHDVTVHLKGTSAGNKQDIILQVPSSYLNAGTPFFLPNRIISDIRDGMRVDGVPLMMHYPSGRSWLFNPQALLNPLLFAQEDKVGTHSLIQLNLSQRSENGVKKMLLHLTQGEKSSYPPFAIDQYGLLSFQSKDRATPTHLYYKQGATANEDVLIECPDRPNTTKCIYRLYHKGLQAIMYVSPDLLPEWEKVRDWTIAKIDGFYKGQETFVSSEETLPAKVPVRLYEVVGHGAFGNKRGKSIDLFIPKELFRLNQDEKEQKLSFPLEKEDVRLVLKPSMIPAAQLAKENSSILDDVIYLGIIIRESDLIKTYVNPYYYKEINGMKEITKDVRFGRKFDDIYGLQHFKDKWNKSTYILESNNTLYDYVSIECDERYMHRCEMNIAQPNNLWLEIKFSVKLLPYWKIITTYSQNLVAGFVDNKSP